jgi:hypothetical protein
MGLFFAWAIGESIIIYRWVKKGAPPAPGALLLPSALFLSLAVLAEYQPARTTATAFAYAVDLAILVQVVGQDPSVSTGWPPPKMQPTQIWPGGTPAPTAAGSAGGTGAQTPEQRAVAGVSRSSRIIKIISELPGFGFVK